MGTRFRLRLLEKVQPSLRAELEQEFGPVIGIRCLRVASNVLTFNHLTESDLQVWENNPDQWIESEWPRILPRILESRQVRDCVDVIRSLMAGRGSPVFESLRNSCLERWSNGRGRVESFEGKDVDPELLRDLTSIKTFRGADEERQFFQDQGCSDQAPPDPQQQDDHFATLLAKYSPEKGGYLETWIDRAAVNKCFDAIKMMRRRELVLAAPPRRGVQIPISPGGGMTPIPGGDHGGDHPEPGNGEDPPPGYGVETMGDPAEIQPTPINLLRQIHEWKRQEVENGNGDPRHVDQSYALTELRLTTWIEPHRYSTVTSALINTLASPESVMERLWADYREAQEVVQEARQELILAEQEQDSLGRALVRVRIEIRNTRPCGVTELEFREMKARGLQWFHGQRRATPAETAEIDSLEEDLESDDQSRAQGHEGLNWGQRRRLEHKLFEIRVHSSPVKAIEDELTHLGRIRHGRPRPEFLEKRLWLMEKVALAAFVWEEARMRVETLKGHDGNLARLRRMDSYREKDRRPAGQASRSDRFWVRSVAEILRIVPGFSQATLSRRLADFRNWIEEYKERDR